MALNISELIEATDLTNTDILHLRTITSIDKRITSNNLSIGLRSYLDKSIAYTILDSDINPIVFSTTAASNLTYDLPTLADNLHKIVRLMKIDAGAGTAILDGEGAETINGELTWILSKQYSYVEVIALASGWFVIDHYDAPFDSGWLLNEMGGSGVANWSNVHLGDDPTDPTDNVTHGQNKPLSELIHKLLISTDGTDNNSFSLELMNYTSAGTNIGFGANIDQIDLNNIKIQTGKNGLTFYNDSGVITVIDIEDWYYKNKVWIKR